MHLWFSHYVVFNSSQLHGLKHDRVPCPSLSPSCCSVTKSCPTLWPHDQASLSFTTSWSLLKLMSIESVMPFNHHPLSLSSPLALNLSQHQGHLQWVGSSHQVAKVLELQLQHQCTSNEYLGLIFFRIELFDFLLSKGRDSQESSPA